MSRSVGRYVIRGELARGGMGVVYRAWDPEAGCEVAVKILLAGRKATEAQRRRFQREVRALSALNHPHIVSFLDVGEAAGGLFLVMELVEGRTLDQRLEQEGPLPLEEAAALARDLADALAVACGQGLLHRDVKPQNVLLTQDGRGLLTDFGLVKDLHRLDTTARLTDQGHLMGSPGYCSPEQAAGKIEAIGPPSDVFSLGATLYAMLTGRPPFQGSSAVEMLVATQEQQVDPPSDSREGVDPALERIVLSCLAKEPAERPSMGDVVDSLDRYLRGELSRERASARGLHVAAAALSVLVLGGAALVVRARKAPDAPPSPTPVSSPVAPAPAPGLDTAALVKEANRYARGDGVPRDGVRAARLLRQAVEAGDVDAKYYLGALYGFGNGVPKDLAMAARWYRRAAEGGNVEAMFNLGVALVRGVGVPTDPSRGLVWLKKAAAAKNANALFALGRLRQDAKDAAGAARWYRRAVDVGDSRAMVNLAGLLEGGGPGLTSDPVESRRLYRQAAERGVPGAMRYLGTLYLEGAGVEEDIALGRKWLERAVAAGDVRALNNLASVWLNGKGVPRDFVKGAALLQRAAAKGSTQAMRNLAGMYIQGQGVSKDPARAVRLLRRAGQGGRLEAFYTLGLLYRDGKGVTKDLAESLRWLRRAAEKGHPRSTYLVAIAYQEGRGTPRDRAAALTWFRRAALAGEPGAMCLLGRALLEGDGLPKDERAAAEWFRKAAAKGNRLGLLNLGILYLQGRGVKQDLARAVRLIRRAAEKGLPRAYGTLGHLYSEGLGVGRDLSEALRWFRKGAGAGDAPAMVAAAQLLTGGGPVAPDPVAAVAWLRKAIATGDRDKAPKLLEALLKKHPSLR